MKLLTFHFTLLTITIPFVILISILIVSARVWASTPTQMIRVSPVILKIKLEPGTTQNYQIKVENLLDKPMPLKVTTEGFDASDEEYGVTIAQQTTSSPLIGWIRIDKKDAILPAKTSRIFNIKITVPNKVPIGGYYAMIFFTPIFPASNAASAKSDSASPSSVGAKIGVLALANIGVKEQKNRADIVTFNFDKTLYEKGPIQTTIRVKNTSLNYFTAKPTLRIKPLFGIEKTFELEEKTILPGKIRRWQRQFDLGNLYGGIYTAKLAVSLENGDYIYSTAHFIGFPVKKAFLAIIGITVLVYVLLNRKGVLKALKILIKG